MSILERLENRLLDRYLSAIEEDERCTCEDGTGFCPEHDDEDEAIDWETSAEYRAELREERER